MYLHEIHLIQKLTSYEESPGFFAVLTIAIYSSAQQTPKVYMVSNAHFDSQWNRDVPRSINDFIPKTIERNLFLLERFPDYIFNFEGGIKYSWMKEYYPEYWEHTGRE